jgi:peptidyl-prolyl cis-trans isomerase A (cyclophilin A)
LLTTARAISPEPLQLIATDPVNDLALLKLSTPAFTVAAFRGERSVRSGEPVIVIGYPLQGLLASAASTTTGVVSSLAGIGDDTRFLQITAPVQPGNSGGPVLDAAGNIVGVVIAKLNVLQMVKLTGAIPENINFAIKESVARSFLEAHGVEYLTASSTRKLETADIAEQAGKFTVRIECRQRTTYTATEDSDLRPQRETKTIVLISTSLGDVKILLYEAEAPITVNNFLSYVRDGFYEGTIFHRVIPNFMIQGGGFTPEMQQKPTKLPIQSESHNGLRNDTGTLAMARTSDPNSATAQFFINLKNNDFLNYDKAQDGVGFTVFDKVMDGMDVVRKMEHAQTSRRGPYSDVPVSPIVIYSIRVLSPSNR